MAEAGERTMGTGDLQVDDEFVWGDEDVSDKGRCGMPDGALGNRRGSVMWRGLGAGRSWRKGQCWCIARVGTDDGDVESIQEQHKRFGAGDRRCDARPRESVLWLIRGIGGDGEMRTARGSRAVDVWLGSVCLNSHQVM